MRVSFSRFASGIILSVALAMSGTAVAGTEVPDITSATTEFSSGIKGELERIVAGHRGVMGLSYKNLDTNEEISVNGDLLFPTASTIKMAVMCTVFEELSRPGGKFKNYYVTMKYDESTSTGGSGFVQNFKNGRPIELKELLHFMITASDNVATNMLVEWLGGLQPVNDWLTTHGFTDTHMFSTVGGKIVWSKEGREKWGLGVTTPNEMKRLLEMLRRGEAGTTSATDEMLRLMGHQYFDSDIPAEVPPWVWVGSKSGALNESRSDNAIVSSPGGTYVLSVYTKENKDRSWGATSEAEKNIRAVSKAIYKYVNPSSTWTRPAGAENF